MERHLLARSGLRLLLEMKRRKEKVARVARKEARKVARREKERKSSSNCRSEF